MAMHVTFLPYGRRTTGDDETSPVITVWEKFNAAHIIINHANIAGGLTVTVYGKEPSGYHYPLLSSNIVASGHTVMKIGPEYTAGANVAKDYIPYQFYVDVVSSGVNWYGITGSVM